MFLPQVYVILFFRKIVAVGQRQDVEGVVVVIELAGVEEDFGYFLYGDIGKLVAALRLELCAAYQQGFIFAQPAMNGFIH